MKDQSLTGKWQFRQAGTETWLPAQVPGGVHTDLLALELIPDPFFADNEKEVQWVAESDWEYQTIFSPEKALLAEPRIELVCDGLDTLAEVWLNGQKLGSSDNMFRQYRWDVRELVNEGENRLRIKFDSPVAYVTAKQAARPMKGVDKAIIGAAHLRKAPCQFGWDWGPILPPIGVWQDIRLEGRGGAALEDVHLAQKHQAGQVKVEIAVSVAGVISESSKIIAQLTGPGGELLQTVETAAAKAASLSFQVQQPELWWPNGYGEQPLYQVEVQLTAAGKLQDQREYKIGLRTVELVQKADQWGKSFSFVINGVPVFAKGSNWIPADSFPTRFTDEQLERLIRDAAASHQNMLRVWGGGFYEEERFYDLCDRYGILVWQDFVFSCSIYPLDEPEFLENVRIEVEENIRRIRHRASLALWCGNNEMEWGWESWGWAKHPLEAQLPTLMAQYPELRTLLESVGNRQPLADWEKLKAAYDRFFHHTLPAWVEKWDPATPYWPSSPSSDTPFSDVNGQSQGDAHYWDVWHGRKPFTAYREVYPRFMSEFGFQALPTFKTIQAYAEEADWNMTSYIMEHHQRGNHGNGLIIGQMTETFRMPKDFESLVYLSNLLQAEGIRYGVEHWRRQMARVSGTLYWQLNDCWPVASWSSIDYFGRWKALHYITRRYFAPLLLSIEDAPPQMGLHVTSDLTQPWQGTLKWSLETLDGKALRTGTETVHARPLASTKIDQLNFGDIVSDANQRELVLVCELLQGDERVAMNVASFVASKHLSLEEPGLSVKVDTSGDTVHFQLTSAHLARFVELSVAGADLVFSDNFFDLPAGRTITVSAQLPTGWSLSQLKSAVRVRSLYDSFA